MGNIQHELVKSPIVPTSELNPNCGQNGDDVSKPPNSLDA